MCAAQTAILDPPKEIAPETVETPTIETLITEADPELPPLPPELLPREEHLITEDDAPVDNFYSEKQQKLSTNTLHATPGPFGEGRSFIAVTNVGLYGMDTEKAQVPDVMISLDVKLADDIWEKGNRSYLVWRFNKLPEVVMEIVSNKVGGEEDVKKDRYEEMRIAYYVIYDPRKHLSEQVIRVYELRGTHYELRKDTRLPDMGLELVLWQGIFEGRKDIWLRWSDRDGNLLPTGAERAEQERQRAEQEHQRAEQERFAREQAQSQNEKLIAQLHALGVEPDMIPLSEEEK